MTVTITPELLADLRKRVALWRQTSVTISHVTPDDVLALLDRIEALERDAEPPCGCGRPATVRGDPECDGCGKDCYFCECKPLIAAVDLVPTGRANDIRVLLDRIQELEREMAADAERAEYWRTEANRVADEHIRQLETRIEALETARNVLGGAWPVAALKSEQAAHEYVRGVFQSVEQERSSGAPNK